VDVANGCVERLDVETNMERADILFALEPIYTGTFKVSLSPPSTHLS